MSKIILVTGGARSGKSLFAERYAHQSGTRIAYIATAQIYDNEMKNRVDIHRSRRPAEWKTFEAPYAAEKAVAEAATTADTILFDCLTIYTSNLLLAQTAPIDKTARYQSVKQAIDRLIKSVESVSSTVIFVTNEVGMSIVPENALAREYRDLAGMVNQMVAASAHEVYLVVSGIPVNIKALAVKLAEEERNG
ncbi:bifunctional adenosylcobinamide kinase/adenosylcobinamide-phosphate guanylyltransferase [bacterium BFN5]|nr:bifunctional adenosylcobinamide kinase/adenosylcobinamide-phosphate guanylyltransferase [bacterium BFN5]